VTADDGSVEHQLRCAQGRLLCGVSEGDAIDALSGSFEGIALLSLPAETLNQHAWVLTWAGRYGEALPATDRARAEAESTGFDFALMHIQLTRAAALTGLRQFSAAQQILAVLSRRLQAELNPWALSNLQIAQAKLQIGVGDLRQAQTCLANAPAAGTYMSQVAEHYGYRGVVSAALGFHLEAEVLAAELATKTNHIERIAFPALIRAVIAAREGDSIRVSEQFELAFSTGLNDSVITACRACPELPAQLSETTHRERLATLLAESRDHALASSAGIRLPRPTRNEETLSPRELEVYELIVQGRTNREISKTLFIAESTTKVHVHHILEKLGVRSRVDAVRAWQLDGASAESDDC
jgi:ATP/maltotriose-dependent transcriptional regulator MalT